MANSERKTGGRSQKSKIRPATVDNYLAKQPPKTRAVLKKLRGEIRAAAPGAVEAISYGMPCWKLDGKPLAYIGGHARHAGFYPTASPIAAFREELAKYEHSKGAIQFPFDKPVPLSLVRKIIKFRKKEIESGKNKEDTCRE